MGAPWLPGHPADAMLAVVAGVLLALALHARWRHGRWTIASRTWLFIGVVFVVVIALGRAGGL